MKFIEKMVEKVLKTSPQLLEKALESSPKLLEVLSLVNEKIEIIVKRVDDDALAAIKLISKTSDRVSDLTTAVINITRTLELHQKAITDLYSAQNAINSALSDKRPSIDLPEIKKSKDEKPN